MPYNDKTIIFYYLFFVFLCVWLHTSYRFDRFVWNLFLTFIAKDCTDVRAIHNSSGCFLILGNSPRGTLVWRRVDCLVVQRVRGEDTRSIYICTVVHEIFFFNLLVTPGVLFYLYDVYTFIFLRLRAIT